MAKQYYCFLERFNNYFNRKIIKYESLSDYISNSKGSFIPTDSEGGMTPFDFNPNDNVTTEIIVNDVPFDPDYFLLLDANANIAQRWFVLEQKRNRQGQWLYQLKRDVVSDNLDNLLKAPIFVQKGMLKEDDPFIVNDEGMSLNQIKESELLIIDDSQTAWIVGYMAKSAGGADISVQVDSESVDIEALSLADIAQAIGTTEGILSSLINLNGDESTIAKFTKNIFIRIALASSGSGTYITEQKFPYTLDTASETYGAVSSGMVKYLFQATDFVTKPFTDAVIDKKSLWENDFASMLGRSYYFNTPQLDILRTFVGRTVKYAGKYYTFSIADKGTSTEENQNLKNDLTYNSITQTVAKAVELSNGKYQSGIYNPSNPNAYVIRNLKLENTGIAIKLTLISDSDVIPQLNTTISSGRKTTSDQEYDVFAIPLNIEVDNNGVDFRTIESYARKMASAIVREQNANVYDLQLLPYCPLPDLIRYRGSIEIEDLTEHTDFDYIFKNVSDVHFAYKEKDDITFTPDGPDTWTASVTLNLDDVPVGKTGTITNVTAYGGLTATITDISYTQVGNTVSVTFTYSGPDPSLPDSPNVIVDVYYTFPEDDVKCGIMFYLSTATFSTAVLTSYLNPYWNDSYERAGKKIVSNCYMFRLVSPNYQGAFEFNLAKNGGRVELFNIFCTYKPFTPVIKVAPNFEWLYGNEFQDNRGLICGGDFSLPRVTDEWRTYELNNKNYQNIFNREIQHLEFTQSIEKRNQLVSGAVGIFSDAAKGAGAGYMVGGGYGAVAGAVIGAGASAVGYAVDVDTMARVHREDKQLAIDKFNYQLGNIKALPYTLTKVGSFDVISKIFPFIEVYKCSDQELKAFEDKIKYESMTVMRIGTLEEFMNFDDDIHYFKGALIRNDEIADDSHVLNAIYEELLKGVYI